MAATVTVLTTTYHGTSPSELERAIDSVVRQTRRPDQFLVVVDGPVPAELDAVLEDAVSLCPTLRVVRLPRNSGNGLASAHGLRLATGDYVARQDSDDVSLPHRLERQLAVAEERSLDIVGSAMLEFVDAPDHVVGLRRAPVGEQAIRARLRINNPFNHPSVLFRRSLAVEVGGYVDVRYHEDYDLWARMLAAGARVDNLEEPLVLFSAGDAMAARRGGRHMLRHEWTMQQRLRRLGVIGPVLQVRNLVVRGAFRLLPPRLLARVYTLLFRRSTAEASARR